MSRLPRHFSAEARRTSQPPITWLMKLALERPNLISLAAGFTDNATLPLAEMRQLTRELFRHPAAARAALQYGPTAGQPELRRQLWRRIRRQDQWDSGHPDQIVVTNGSQQALALTTAALCDAGDIVLVEDPTYFVYLGITQALGVRTAAFDGVSGLARRLASLKASRQLGRVKLLYAVTYFRNPTGQTWSLEDKREALAILKHYERAAGHPIYILEDAAYRDLRFAGADVPSFLALDPRPRRVAYTNTLTKPFATGLKLGYGILPAPLQTAVLHSKANHDFGSSHFLQELLARALASGLYDRHLPVIAAGYRRKCQIMVRALQRYFPPLCRYRPPQGGLYIWVSLPPGRPTGLRSRIFQRALQAGVLYVPGQMCYAPDPTRRAPNSSMRLSFASASGREIVTGIRRLAGAIGV